MGELAGLSETFSRLPSGVGWNPCSWLPVSLQPQPLPYKRDKSEGKKKDMLNTACPLIDTSPPRLVWANSTNQALINQPQSGDQPVSCLLMLVEIH